MRKENSGCAGALRCGKGTTYEGGMRVPAMIQWQNKIEPGVSRDLVSTLDLLPTILSLVGVKQPNDLHGFDLKELLFNGGKVSNFIRV